MGRAMAYGLRLPQDSNQVLPPIPTSTHLRKGYIVPKYRVTIVADFIVDIEDLERDQEDITLGYTLPEFPMLPEEAVEHEGGSITYEELEK